MVVIVGHTRLEAAKALGLKTVPVHVAEGLSPAQAKAYRLMDNRSHENAEWDDELLRLEFGDATPVAGRDIVTAWHDGRRLTAVVDDHLPVAIGEPLYLRFPPQPDAVFPDDADAAAALADAAAAASPE